MVERVVTKRERRRITREIRCSFYLELLLKANLQTSMHYLYNN